MYQDIPNLIIKAATDAGHLAFLMKSLKIVEQEHGEDLKKKHKRMFSRNPELFELITKCSCGACTAYRAVRETMEKDGEHEK